jgi:nucleotide-binding universal stress UspA family protein
METEVRPTRIVVGVDDSEMGRVVIEHALDLAARHRPAELHFLRVVTGSLLHRPREAEVEAAHDRLAREVRTAIDDFGGTPARVRVHACAGDPVDEVDVLAEDVGAELIVVGRHGGLRGASRLGSVPQQLLEQAHASVLVIQPDVHQASGGQAVCPDCATVRADSGGDQWFCERHSDDRPWRSTQLMTDSFMPLGSGQLL